MADARNAAPQPLLPEPDAGAEPGANPPLPPLPTGNLAQAIPTWLREHPASVAPDTEYSPPGAPIPVTRQAGDPHRASTAGVANAAHSAVPTLLSDNDPAGFLTVEDLPLWLRQLATDHAVEPGKATGNPLLRQIHDVSLTSPRHEASNAGMAPAPLVEPVEPVDPMPAANDQTKVGQSRAAPVRQDQAGQRVALPVPAEPSASRSSWRWLILALLAIGLVILIYLALTGRLGANVLPPT